MTGSFSRPQVAPIGVLLLLFTVTAIACEATPGALPGPTQPLITASPHSTAQPTLVTQAPPATHPAATGPSSTPDLSEPPIGAAPIGETEPAVVVSVVDGDTIKIDRGQGVETVRYIGVDTPETVHPTKPVEWMGKEASAANRALVEGRNVLLERDLTEYDRYGRLLRYVWVEDPEAASGWTFVNLALVAGGFAQVVTYPPDVRYVDLYLTAQRDAREQGLGLWADPGPGVGESPPPTAEAGASCDPAYPGVCIPPPPPDLDCGDVPFRRFKVLPADPHHFDLDFDGVGCES